MDKKTTLLLKHNWVAFVLIQGFWGWMWWFMITLPDVYHAALIFIYLELFYVSALFIKYTYPGRSLRLDSFGITCVDTTWFGLKKNQYRWSAIQRIEYSGRSDLNICFRLHPQNPTKINFADYFIGAIWIDDSMRFSFSNALPLQTIKDICKENNIPFVVG